MRKARRHPAGRLAFTLRGNATVALIDDKLASFLSAKEPLSFANRLAPQVRSAYRRLWIE